MIRMKKKRLKPKWRNIMIILVIIVSFSMLIYASINIFKWFIDNNKSQQIITDLEEKIVVTQDNEISGNTVQNEEEIKENDPYWDFIKMSLIDVDINELKEINDETVGWLKVNGTNINYPFVQASDNKYYLTHDFYKQNNGGGWVFLDYRNKSNLEDKNNIIYAHGRANETMFGSLKNILSSDWINDQKNFTIQVSTQNKNTLWQVFSIYKILNTNDYITTNFNNDEEFSSFITKLINRSNFDFKTTVNKNDIILTLSTCYNDYQKVVLHAKLIKTT